MKVRQFTAGCVALEKTSGGMYVVILRKGDNVMDKVRVETSRIANEYFRAFCLVARQYR